MFEYLIVIYIVHDTNIRLYFYIASDILKKSEKKCELIDLSISCQFEWRSSLVFKKNQEFYSRPLIHIHLNTNQINLK